MASNESLCKDCFWYKNGKCYNRLLNNQYKQPDPECWLWEPILDERTEIEAEEEVG